MSDNSANNKRIAKNTMLLYVRMFLIMAISLYTSRVVLKTLGVEDYGIYNVVGGLIAMFGFVNASLTSGTQRFITFALGKKSQDDVNKVFSSSILIHWGVALCFLVLAETIGLWFLYNKMIIPDNRLFAAFWVYQMVVLSTLVFIISVPYNAYIIAEERMSAFAYISVVEVILKLVVVFIIVVATIDRLILYSIFIFLIQLFVRLCYTRYCKKNFPYLHFQKSVDKDLTIRMLKFSAWSMNGNLAIVAATQGLNVLLNMFFGPAVNAARGIAFQVQSKVYSFCTNFQLAARPQITKFYAVGDYTNLHALILSMSKFSYYLLLFISLPVMMNINVILKIWLTIVPQYTSSFVIVMLLTCMVRSLAEPLITAIHATGNIKKFQIWEGTILLLILPMAYILLKFYQIDPVKVMCVFLFTEVLAQVVRIIIVLPAIRLPFDQYFKSVVIRVLLVSFISVLMPYEVKSIFHESSIIGVIISCMICLFSVAISVYFCGCNEKERKMIKKASHRILTQVKSER